MSNTLKEVLTGSVVITILCVIVALVFEMSSPQSCGGRDEGVYEFKVGDLKSGGALYKIEVYDSHQCLTHEKYYTKDSEGFYIDM